VFTIYPEIEETHTGDETMRAHKINPTLIRITSNGDTIGHATCEEFRKALNSRNDFIANLIERFNAEKERQESPKERCR